MGNASAVTPRARSDIRTTVAVGAVLLAVAACTSAGGQTRPTTSRPASPTSASVLPPVASDTPTGSPAPTRSAPRRARGTFTIAFAGDVHFAERIGERLDRNPATVFGEAAPGLRRADLTMVNLETALTTGGDQQAKEFTFRAPPRALVALRDAGIDVATMANNHGADYGAFGLRDSLAARAEVPLPDHRYRQGRRRRVRAVHARR